MLLNILVIAASVGLAVAGEIQFSMLGFLFQLASLVFDANRLVMIQILLSDEGQRMDPLVSLYYSAPVCAVMNFLVAWKTEWAGFQLGEISRNTGAALVLNAAVGFMLNVSIFVLVCPTYRGFCLTRIMGCVLTWTDRQNVRTDNDARQHPEEHPADLRVCGDLAYEDRCVADFRVHDCVVGVGVLFDRMGEAKRAGGGCKGLGEWALVERV